MSTIRTSVDLALDPAAAFELLTGELAYALNLFGIRFEAGAGGRVFEHQAEVGRVVAWKPGEGASIEWHPADWDPAEVTQVELRLAPSGGRTEVTFELRGWGGLIGEEGELAGWFAGEILAPMLWSCAPSSLGDWLTDRRARRPSGSQSRAVYRDPLYHYPNFRVLLSELALDAGDYLLEVGCGGGALLKEALRSGCRAAAIDHSPDMVRLALEVNREAASEGRLAIQEARADALPFPDATFSCAVMTGVLGFLPDPVAALREIRRVLARGGRYVMAGERSRDEGHPRGPRADGFPSALLRQSRARVARARRRVRRRARDPARP